LCSILSTYSFFDLQKMQLTKCLYENKRLKFTDFITMNYLPIYRQKRLQSKSLLQQDLIAFKLSHANFS